jgi:hypothetical protein
MEFDKDKVLKGVSSYRKAGVTAQENAAYSGSMHDGGGAKIIAVADAYIAGLNMQVPFWLAQQIEGDSNSDKIERAEYERLKAKFND